MSPQLILTSPTDQHPPLAVASIHGLLAAVNLAWEALVAAYHDGTLAAWFREIGRPQLAEAVEEVTRTAAVASPGQRCRNLQNLLTTQLDFPDPHVKVSPVALDWGLVDRNQAPGAQTLSLQNDGLGCAYGWVTARRPELEVTEFESFTLVPGESTVRQIRLKPDALRPTGLHASAGITIRLRVTRSHGPVELTNHIGCYALLAPPLASTPPALAASQSTGSAEAELDGKQPSGIDLPVGQNSITAPVPHDERKD